MPLRTPLTKSRIQVRRPWWAAGQTPLSPSLHFHISPRQNAATVPRQTRAASAAPLPLQASLQPAKAHIQSARVWSDGNRFPDLLSGSQKAGAGVEGNYFLSPDYGLCFLLVMAH